MDVNVVNGYAPPRAVSEPNLQPAPAPSPVQQAPVQTQVEVTAPAPTPRIAQSEPVALQGDQEAPPALREEDVNNDMIERAFADANRALAGGNFRLSYGIHEATNRVTVAVYDTQTNELIRELPPEARLDLYARITEFTGLLFDQSS